MKPSLRSLFPQACLPILLVAGVLNMCEVCRAQSPGKTAETPASQKKSGPQKPTRDTGWVTTNDPVALLSVRKAPRIVEAPATDAAGLAEGKGASATEDESASKAAEIVSVEKQIQDKQKRIALLLRLFVKDERPFLNDPESTGAGTTAQERRKYEQNELLYETAELAKLKAKLEELTAASGEKTAANP
jgi:uncharacterized protein YeeX (DUF496 family)